MEIQVTVTTNDIWQELERAQEVRIICPSLSEAKALRNRLSVIKCRIDAKAKAKDIDPAFAYSHRVLTLDYAPDTKIATFKLVKPTERKGYVTYTMLAPVN